ncbi:hypothetical protein SEVIR_5G370600v4 [Setaria viridis]
MTPPASKGKSAGGLDDEPLLPEFFPGDGGGGGASVSGAVFNVSTSIVGAGIMSIPAAMRVLGVAPALLLIAAVAALADVSVEFMLRYTRWAAAKQATTYAGLMGDAFGRAGAAVLNVCIASTTTGTLVVYLIIIGKLFSCAAPSITNPSSTSRIQVDRANSDNAGDVMSGSVGGGDEHAGVLRELFGARWWTGREFVLLVTAVFVLLPLVLRRRVDSLRFTSAISIMLAVVFMLISLGIAVYALLKGTATMPRMLPDFSRLSSPFELFTAVPVIVVAFTFHFNVHPIRAELSKTSDMKAAVRISLVLCAAIYAAVGFFGFLLFGDATMADVLANFDRSSGAGVPQALNDAARLSYALHLVLVFPLLFFSLRVNVDELLFPGRRPLATDTRRFVSLTAVLMAVLYALAIAIPSIWTLFEYSGSTFAVTISLIFPGAIVLRDVHGIAKRKDKALAATMIILAVVTSSIAIASNIMSSISDKVREGHDS